MYIHSLQHSEAFGDVFAVDNFSVVHEVLPCNAGTVDFPHVPFQFSILFVVSQSPGQGCSRVTNIAHRGVQRLTVLMWACKFVYYVGRFQEGCFVVPFCSVVQQCREVH